MQLSNLISKGIQRAVTGNFVGDIANAVQMYVESLGYSIVRNGR